MLPGLQIVTRSPQETRLLGATLAPMLLPGDVVSLTGDLGAGKTVFVQGVVTALGVEGRVTSPSFLLVHEYRARYPIVHLDVYRLDSFQEVLDLGFEELADPEAILLVEWGEAVAPLLPPQYLEIDLRRTADVEAGEERVLTFVPRGQQWGHKLDRMRVTAEELLNAGLPSDGGRHFVEVPDRSVRGR